MSLLDGLTQSPGFLTFATLVLGLCLGSFINVVAYRLPRMMDREWKRECRTILELPAAADETPLSLLTPASRCPSCNAAIKPWHNIPVFGWLWLRGRCASCQARIAVQYPLVEAATGLLSAACAWRFGWGPQLLPALLLTWSLVALAVIDLNTQLLPDSITLPLLWLGLLLSLAPVFAPVRSSIIGAAAGYLTLWCVYHLFRLVTGKEGMGYGDFKLLAALGAWLGWKMILPIVLGASVIGAIIGIAMKMSSSLREGRYVPFGPFLAGAGLVVVFAGPERVLGWLRWS